MKKILFSYYTIIVLIIFIIYNIVLENIKIGGLLYQVIMIILIIANAIILVKFKKNINHKNITYVVYFFIWLFSKNILQCYFVFSNIIVICITGFIDSKFIRIFSIVIALFTIVFFYPLLFIFLMVFGTSLSGESQRKDIYNDMHYYCDNNYEVYSYSTGAMDEFHYSIGRHYEFLDINGIIYISYNERDEVSEEEYDNYLNNHNCELVGDINGFD